MFRAHTRWLTLAAATLVVAAVLPASAALADTAPGSITGHLLDGTTPVANANVDIIDSNFFIVGGAITDATGAFTAGDIAPGSYIVEFRLPGGGLTQYYHGQLALQSANQVTVTAGATTSVEETVVTHGALGGTLTDSNGAPVPFAFVSIASPSLGVFLNAATDQNGRYLASFTPPGTYTVSFQTQSGFGQTAHNKAPGQPGDPFTVVAGATTTVDEQLVAPGTFTGRVTTADGLPAANVEVFASSLFQSRFTLTDSNGVYTVPVFPGSYQISFQREPSGLTQWAHGQTSVVHAPFFPVASGETAVVDEQLLPTGTLAGHLNDSNGQPVSFGNVVVTGNGLGFPATIFNGDWHADVYPGTYTVEFDLSGDVNGIQFATGKTSAADADHFTVQVGQTTQVDDTLAAPGTVTLTVHDSVTGAPVSWCGEILAAFACSDSSGTATLPPLLPGKQHIFAFPSDGTHLPVETDVTVVSGQNTTLDLASDPGATITTTVRDSKTGAPLANICPYTVRASSPSGATAGFGSCTDSTGKVTFTGLAPGSYNVFSYANDGVHGHQWVGPNGGTGIKEKASVFTLTVGQTLTIPDIKMDKAGILTGVIRDRATGAGIPGAIASWGTSPSGLGGSSADVAADANGRYTFTNLGPYNWPIFYHALGYASEWSGNTGNRLQSNPVTVKAGKTRTHNETLTQGISITGLVTDPQGRPVGNSGSRVTMYNFDSGDEIGSDDPGPDSTYTVHALPRQNVGLVVDEFLDDGPITFWYNGATDSAHATPIKVTKPGPIVVNLAAPASG
jgi:protocatechuate 3,4-dioxygenase beta subunit